MGLANIDTFEIIWAAILTGGVGHVYLWIRSLKSDRKEQDGKIHDLETKIAVMESREETDYKRLEGIERRLKAIEECNVGIKLVLERLTAHMGGKEK